MAWRTASPHLRGTGIELMPSTQEMTMKKFAIAGFMTAMMVAMASNAMARDQQATGPELDNQLNWQMQGDFGGARASAHVPSRIRTNPSADQQAIDFQATGQSGSY
jgi:hypothetical protein